ncbi:MAG: TonB-dependent receptor [Myxococcales bacterium]|nr:TonB-dependent receptor [Myxococcales bacterium]
MRRGLGVAVWLWAAAASAAGVADEAEFHFRRGLAFEKQGKLEEALEAFYASNRLVPNRNVQLNIASALGRLKLYDEAFRAYSELLGQPSSAEERAEVERALSYLRPMLALVKVDSAPKGALIFAERRDLGALGATEKVLALKPGRTRILLDLPGYRSAEVEVELSRGKEAVVFRELERIYGELELFGLPREAEVRLEGVEEPILRGPGRVRLVPGRVALLITAPGFKRERLEREVLPDQLRSEEVSLERESRPPPKVGALVVRANVDGATVTVGKLDRCFTPCVVEKLEVGEWEVAVSQEGRDPFRTMVEVKENQLLPVLAHLRPKRMEVAGATQRLIRLDDAPASMTVITAEEIRAFGYATVAEALRSVRGLHVWSDRARDSVGVRGFGWPESANARVLVLVNGHPLNELVRGYGPIGMDLGIDMEQVERIEVVRGGGMVFGSTAFLGLVNVVMRRPEVGPHVRGAFALDTDGRQEARALASVRKDWGELLALAGIAGGAGQPLSLPGETQPRLDGWNGRQAFLSARLGPVTLTAGTIAYGKSVPTGYGWSGENGVASLEGRSFAALQLEHEFPGGSFLLARLAADAAGHSLSYGGPDGSALSEHAGYGDLSGELRFEWAVHPKHRLLFGAASGRTPELWQRAQASAAPEPMELSAPETKTTFYMSHEWVPRPSFRLNLGLRFDPVGTIARGRLAQVERVMEWGNPHIALVLKPYEGGNTKLVFDATVRRTTPRELTFGFPPLLREAPAKLGEEQRGAFEVEHAHTLSDEASLVGVLFLNSFNAIISSAPAESGALVYGNSAPYAVVGSELELRWTPGDGRFLSLSNVYQGSTGAVGSLINSPEHNIAARLSWPILSQALLASTEMVFLGARKDRDGARIPETMQWNLVLSGDYLPWRLHYYGGVMNLLDERRADPLGPDTLLSQVPRYGRQVRVGFSRSF